MSAVWSDEQRRCLAALGYTLYRSAAASESNADFAREVSVAIAANSGNGMVPAPKKQIATTIDPLLHALMRAVGCDHAQAKDADAWKHAQQIPSLAQLRNNPAAKRALWPRLRALRKERAGR